jgi:hypothetical protein
MKIRRRIKKTLKTVPGKLAAAILTAVVGAAVAYFAPGILDSLTGKDEPQISVQTDPAKIDTFDDLAQMVIVPYSKHAGGNPGSGCDGFASWAEGVGGVDASRTDFRVVVQGGSETIYIGGIRARLLERSQALSGVGFRCPSAGAAEVRSVVIDLDQRGSNPAGVWVVGGSEKNISFTVAPGETEVFDVTAHTETCFCKWALELETTQGGEEKVITVEDHGHPFETTAWGGAPAWEAPPPLQLPPFYDWNWSEEKWNAVRDGEPGAEYLPGKPLPFLPTSGEPPE